MNGIKTLWIGNMPYSTTEYEFTELLAPYNPARVQLMMDAETGQTRGFGFADMLEADADRAMDELQNADFGGRRLMLNEARPRVPKDRHVVSTRPRRPWDERLPMRSGREARL